MKKNIENSCISIAIFYDETGWSSLILDGIIPFFKKNKEKSNYILSLNKERGNHVKIFVITPKNNVRLLLKKVDKFFKGFILNNQICKSRNLISGNGIFCDFEPNSIHYGIYDCHLCKSQNDKTLYFQERFSQFLITTFKKYEEETILSLTEIMIGLFAVFLDASSLKKAEVIELFDKLLTKEYSKYNEKTIKKIHILNRTNFTKNKEHVIDFLKGEEYKSDKLEMYQKQWKHIINAFYGQFKHVNEEEYLINKLCDIFNFEDRISAYYLFVNALKII
ncbi:MAG: hypothetical protein ABJL44_07875 [Algibacter sp.]